MMKFEMTYHAKEERIDRLVKCVELIGVGDVILTASNEEESLAMLPGTLRVQNGRMAVED